MEKIPSISTDEFIGKLDTPTATLVCFPFSPKIFTIIFEEKFKIKG